MLFYPWNNEIFKMLSLQWSALNYCYIDVVLIREGLYITPKYNKKWVL